MPLYYSRKTLVLSRLLEVAAFIALSPALGLLFVARRLGRKTPRTVLLVEPFGMGDVLSLSVMLDPLRQAFPGSKIVLLTKTGNEQIYAADRRVDAVFTAPFPWSRLSGQKRGSWRDWMAVLKTCCAVARLRPDIGLDTRSEIRSQIVMVLCGCRRRIGFLNYLNTNINVLGWLLSTRVKKPSALHRYDMNRLLLKDGLGIPLPPLTFPSFRPELPVSGQNDGSSRVVFHIGARWKYRQWPAERWTELGRRLQAIGISPVVAGAASERSILERVCDPAGLSREELDMESLIRRIAGCDLLVCLDSGPMHLAQTLGIPVVALFGPGDFDLWRPKGRCDQALFHRLPCNPCLQNECVRPADSCMPMITVDEVFEAIQNVLLCKQEG